MRGSLLIESFRCFRITFTRSELFKNINIIFKFMITSGAEPNEVWRSVAKFYLSVRGWRRWNPGRPAAKVDAYCGFRMGPIDLTFSQYFSTSDKFLIYSSSVVVVCLLHTYFNSLKKSFSSNSPKNPSV